MLAMIRAAPPQAWQVSTSTRWIDAQHQERVPWGIRNTRLRRKHPVVAGQIHPRPRYQRRQPRHEVQRLDKIAGSNFEQPKAGPKGGGLEARSKMTCVVPSRYGVFNW
jgi:hypothetical protein